MSTSATGPRGGPLHVFVSGPYSSFPEWNLYRACKLGVRLLELGHHPFIPHLSHYLEQTWPQPYETWMRLDLAWLERCDVVVRIPGHSPGADREVDRALELGLPVLFLGGGE